MTYILWNNDVVSGSEPQVATLTQWDGIMSGADVKANLEEQIESEISFPSPTVDFGTGECRFDSFTWSAFGNTYSVPAISIPVGAVVYAYINDTTEGFTLQLTTMEWLRLHGQIKAIY